MSVGSPSLAFNDANLASTPAQRLFDTMTHPLDANEGAFEDALLAVEIDESLAARCYEVEVWFELPTDTVH
jgi:hypothetical protein